MLFRSLVSIRSSGQARAARGVAVGAALFVVMSAISPSIEALANLPVKGEAVFKVKVKGTTAGDARTRLLARLLRRLRLRGMPIPLRVLPSLLSLLDVVEPHLLRRSATCVCVD